jgi:hypothetical protein
MPSLEEACDHPSTNWAWKKVKIKPAHPQGTARSSTNFVRGRRRRVDVRRGTQTLEVVYRGGAEDAWLVRLGGRSWYRVPGWLCLTDCLARLETWQ